MSQNYILATKKRRWFASMIDGILLSIMFWIIFFIVMIVLAADNTAQEGTVFEFLQTSENTLNIYSIMSTVVTASIIALFTSSNWMGTPGQKLLGIEVRGIAGNKLDFVTAFKRYIVLIGPFLLITILAILSTPELSDEAKAHKLEFTQYQETIFQKSQDNTLKDGELEQYEEYLKEVQPLIQPEMSLMNMIAMGAQVLIWLAWLVVWAIMSAFGKPQNIIWDKMCKTMVIRAENNNAMSNEVS